MDTVVQLLRQGGISLLNGLFLVAFAAWENLLTLLQIPLGLLLFRLVEVPQARVEGFTIGGRREASTLLQRGGGLLGVLLLSILTSLFFPGTIDAILLVIWLLGGLAAVVIRMERVNLIARTKTAVLTEVGVLWGVKFFRTVVDLARMADWAVATGLTQEGAAEVLARNIGYVNPEVLRALELALPALQQPLRGMLEDELAAYFAGRTVRLFAGLPPDVDRDGYLQQFVAVITTPEATREGILEALGQLEGRMGRR